MTQPVKQQRLGRDIVVVSKVHHSGLQTKNDHGDCGGLGGGSPLRLTRKKLTPKVADDGFTTSSLAK